MPCSAWRMWAVSTHWCCSGPQIPLGAFTCPCSASSLGLEALTLLACGFLSAPCSHHPPFGTIWSFGLPRSCVWVLKQQVRSVGNGQIKVLSLFMLQRTGVWWQLKTKRFKCSDSQEHSVVTKLYGTVTFLNSVLGCLIFNLLADVMY